MRIVSAIAASLHLAAASSALAVEYQPTFGAPLKCSPGSPVSVHVVAQQIPSFKPDLADAARVVQSMARIGYPAKLPAPGAAREAALRAAALLHRGNVVAAKMANDESAMSISGYKDSAFASSFESLLTVLTQPVQHASYPSSVRADGETRPAHADHSHTHGVDIEQSTASLIEIISRVATSQKALGAAYRNATVRYYILANGFRDDIALKAAAGAVCGQRLDAASVKKLNISARFVAMPSQFLSESAPK